MRLVVLAFVAAAAATTVPADAQLVNKQTLVKKRLVLSRVAECLVRTADGLSDRLLHTERGSPRERQAFSTLVQGHVACIKDMGGISMNVGTSRGAVAQAMFARRPEMLARAKLLGATPVSRPELDNKAGVDAFLIRYSECLTASDPAHAVALVETPEDGPEERAGVLAFGPALSACMPLTIRYHMNLGDVRNHVAAALYLAAAGSTGA